MLDATRRIAAAVDADAGLRILGNPEMNLVAFTSDTLSVFHIIDEMKARGWYVQPQLGFGGSKENIHLSVNPASVRWVDALIADLRTCVDAVAARPPDGTTAQIREAVASLAGSDIDPAALSGLLGAVGVEGTKLPDRMASINEALNALPVALRERLLVEYLNELYRPHGD